MQTENRNNQIRIENIRDFDLDHIFDCGQCFRFEKEADGSYTGIAFGKVVNMAFELGGAGSVPEPISELISESDADTEAGADARSNKNAETEANPSQSTDTGSNIVLAPDSKSKSKLDTNSEMKFEEVLCEARANSEAESNSKIVMTAAAGSNTKGTLTISNATEADFEQIWRNYLDLDRDYGKIKRYLAGRDPIIQKAIDYGSGIRILRQDPWETVLSFIVSQNNNIPRIKKCIDSLAQNFGEKAGSYKGKTYFSLPAPEILAKLEVEDLAPCRLGYRAKYIVQTARMICEDEGTALRKATTEDVSAAEAFQYITSLCGVGPKVANCILLFALQKYDSFPIDVWVKKVMHELYGIPEKDTAAMARFAKETYGVWGGMAQQYLFYYIRENS